MDTTYLTFKQTDRNNQYVSGPCACFYCTVKTNVQECKSDINHVRDWNIGMTACCGDWCTRQNVCVPLNADVCKTPSFVRAEWDKIAPNVKCIYNTQKLQGNIEEIATLAKRFGTNHQFMWDVCKYPLLIRGKQYNPIHASGQKGDLCRDWWSQQPTHIKTRFIQEYCVTYPEAEDCKCANRARDPLYREIKKVNAVNDGCWYAPCADTMHQFVEDNLVNTACPTILCSTFLNIINNKGPVSIKKFQSNIICGNNTDSKPPEIVETGTMPQSIVIMILLAAIVTLII